MEQHLEQEQEFQVNKLMKKIKKLENDTITKQLTLEQVAPTSSSSGNILSVIRVLFVRPQKAEKWDVSASLRFTLCVCL